MTILEIESAHTSGLYNKHQIVIVSGKGAILFDEAGREYIDCMSGHGVANLGHAQPEVAKAISEQASTLITLPETYFNNRRAALMDKLSQLVPGYDRFFFCNSGAEAVEAAIKFARLSTGKTEIIAAMRAFHGRTMGALSATWNKTYRQPFEPLVPGFRHVPFNDLSALDEAFNDNTAAFIIEIIQGEGGVHRIDPQYLHRIQEKCQETGSLLIVDEIQTGLGRTGKLFAFQHYAAKPDMVCVAKSLAGGLPMGAVLIGERIKNLAPGMHGSTFGGNPLACAAALTVLEVLERDQLPQAALEKGEYFRERIEELNSPVIREVRGLGLMIGIELKQKIAPYVSNLTSKGVLTLPAGLTVIRLLPPLVISYAQIDQVLGILRQVLV